MIKSNDIMFVHNMLVNAIGFNEDFTIEIGKNSISDLDKCIEKLRNMLRNEGIKLPDYLKGKISSIGKYDKLEWITKIVYVVELANRLAKLPQISNLNKREFYLLKALGIDALSRIDANEEISDRGGGTDIGKSGFDSNYTVQIDKYDERAVISWHLGMIDPNSDFGHLIDVMNDRYQVYNGEDIGRYNSFSRDDFNFAKMAGVELRYNEKGISTLSNMLFTRGENKLGIKEIISNNFPMLDISGDELDKLLNGDVLNQEEEIYNEGGYSGVKVIESEIKSKIKNAYLNDSSKEVDEKFCKLYGLLDSKDDEKNAESIYLLNKILSTIDFQNGDFEKILKMVENRLNIANNFHRKLGTVDEIGEKYEMFAILGNLGINDFDENISILDKVENEILKDEFSINSMKTLIVKIKNIFGSFKFTDYDVEPDTVVDAAILSILDKLNRDKINREIFKDGEKTSKLLKSIKQEVSDKFKEMESEKKEGTISIEELDEFVKAQNCTKTQMLEVAQALLDFVFEKGSHDLGQNPISDAVEIATSELPSKGILELREKILKGEYVGGGRY